MPVSITINCHSDRTSSCTITENNIEYNHKTPSFIEFDNIKNEKQEIFSNEIEKIRVKKAIAKGDFSFEDVIKARKTKVNTPQQLSLFEEDIECR